MTGEGQGERDGGCKRMLGAGANILTSKGLRARAESKGPGNGVIISVENKVSVHNKVDGEGMEVVEFQTSFALDKGQH